VIEAVARFAAMARAAWLMAVWGVAEALLLPVVPDVGLALLVLARPRRAALLFAAVVGGAAVGSAAMWALASSEPAVVERLLVALPGIDAMVLVEAERRVATEGITAFAQVGPGIPLKVWTASWADVDGPLLGAVAGSVLNRVTRIGPVIVAAWLVGTFAAGWLRRHDRAVVALYAIGWLAIYALVLFRTG
jgi:membrane protein YqaA with SNARE-associated domain